MRRQLRMLCGSQRIFIVLLLLLFYVGFQTNPSTFPPPSMYRLAVQIKIDNCARFLETLGGGLKRYII